MQGTASIRVECKVLPSKELYISAHQQYSKRCCPLMVDKCWLEANTFLISDQYLSQATSQALRPIPLCSPTAVSLPRILCPSHACRLASAQGLCKCKTGLSNACLLGEGDRYAPFPPRRKETAIETESSERLEEACFRGLGASLEVQVICFLVLALFPLPLCCPEGEDSGVCLHRSRASADTQMGICTTSSGFKQSFLEGLKPSQRKT